MYEYYRSHLEDYSEEFRIQMNEFRDGNLFFEIMQQENMEPNTERFGPTGGIV